MDSQRRVSANPMHRRWLISIGINVYMVHVRHIKTAKLMVNHLQHGADNWNYGLYGACTSHRIS